MDPFQVRIERQVFIAVSHRLDRLEFDAAGDEERPRNTAGRSSTSFFCGSTSTIAIQSPRRQNSHAPGRRGNQFLIGFSPGAGQIPNSREENATKVS